MSEKISVIFGTRNVISRKITKEPTSSIIMG